MLTSPERQRRCPPLLASPGAAPGWSPGSSPSPLGWASSKKWSSDWAWRCSHSVSSLSLPLPASVPEETVALLQSGGRAALQTPRWLACADSSSSPAAIRDWLRPYSAWSFLLNSLHVTPGCPRPLHPNHLLQKSSCSPPTNFLYSFLRACLISLY